MKPFNSYAAYSTIRVSQKKNNLKKPGQKCRLRLLKTSFLGFRLIMHSLYYYCTFFATVVAPFFRALSWLSIELTLSTTKIICAIRNTEKKNTINVCIFSNTDIWCCNL
ncbi:hypothetical protein Hanom_Chr07g00669921 [Helianthus anomalus]